MEPKEPFVPLELESDDWGHDEDEEPPWGVGALVLVAVVIGAVWWALG
jgi:hypothetical protein